MNEVRGKESQGSTLLVCIITGHRNHCGKSTILLLGRSFIVHPGFLFHIVQV